MLAHPIRYFMPESYVLLYDPGFVALSSISIALRACARRWIDATFLLTDRLVQRNISRQAKLVLGYLVVAALQDIPDLI